MDIVRHAGSVEETWDMRVAVLMAAQENPSYRGSVNDSKNPPRLEGMDSLDSVQFVVALEDYCKLRFSDREIEERILRGRQDLGVRELGEIADYFCKKKYGGGRE